MIVNSGYLENLLVTRSYDITGNILSYDYNALDSMSFLLILMLCKKETLEQTRITVQCKIS